MHVTNINADQTGLCEGSGSELHLHDENHASKRAPIFHVINVTAGENDTTKRAPIFHVVNINADQTRVCWGSGSAIHLHHETNANNRAPIFNVINVTAGEIYTAKRAPIFHLININAGQTSLCWGQGAHFPCYQCHCW